MENQRGQDIDDSWVRDRRKEFEELIDANRDGVVTMEELEVSAEGVPGSRGPEDGPQRGRGAACKVVLSQEGRAGRSADPGLVGLRDRPHLTAAGPQPAGRACPPARWQG